MTILAQTLQLAFRIAIVWAGGFLLAAAVNALLPDKVGITLYGKEDCAVVPFSRIGFWTCMLAALTVTALVCSRAMLADVGWRSFTLEAVFKRACCGPQRRAFHGALILLPMQNDPLVEWQKLTETYSKMYDDELLDLAADSDDLTELAQQVLRDEMRKRGLELHPESQRSWRHDRSRVARAASDGHADAR